MRRDLVLRQLRRSAARSTAPLVGLLGAGLLVWQGSAAAMTARTDTSAQAWSSGTLVLANNGGGTALSNTTTTAFAAPGLVPGATDSRCLTVRSSSTVAGTIRFYRSELSDSTPSLGDQLELTVDAAPVAGDVLADCAGFPASGATRVVAATPLTGLPTSYDEARVGVPVDPGTQRVAYRVTYVFVSTGTVATDDLLQGRSVTAGFAWELQ